jgi:hypothetical protein
VHSTDAPIKKKMDFMIRMVFFLIINIPIELLEIKKVTKPFETLES